MRIEILMNKREGVDAQTSRDKEEVEVKRCEVNT